MTIGELQKLLSETPKDSPVTLLNYDGTPVKITPVTHYIVEIKKEIRE